VPRLAARSGSARFPRTLTPTMGRQNHTISPSATSPLVSLAATTHELLRPAITCAHDSVASTAPNPAFVTIAIRPFSGGRDVERETYISEKRNLNIERGLDRNSRVPPVGQIRSRDE